MYRSVYVFKGALQLLITAMVIRFAQVPKRVSTKSVVILIIGNSKSNHLGAQGTFDQYLAVGDALPMLPPHKVGSCTVELVGGHGRRQLDRLRVERERLIVNPLLKPEQVKGGCI